MNREDIKASLEEAKALANKLKPTFDVPPQSVTGIEHILLELLQKKLHDDVIQKFGFYTVDQLIEALEIFNEKPKEAPRPAIVRSFAGGAGEVQSKPALEQSGKQAVHKDGKRPVPKRV